MKTVFLFGFLTSFALKSAAVLGLAWVVSIVLRARSAALRHALWAAAAAGVLALPLFSVSLPALSVPSFSRFAPGVAAFFDATVMAARRVAPAAVPVSASVPHVQPIRALPDWRLGLISAWLLGIAAMLAQMVYSLAQLSRIRRSARTSPAGAEAARLAQELNLSRGVTVIETKRGSMPMASGLVRATIYLPEDARDWPRERRHAVLLHELAHIKRGDVIAHGLGRLALILNWWNPLAWFAWRELLKEGERSADDVVLAFGTSAAEYASQLLEIARLMQAPPALSPATVGMARRSELEGRIVAILDSRIPRSQLGRASLYAAVVGAVAVIAPLAAVHAQDQRSADPVFQASVAPTDIDATIRAAKAQNNFEILEKPAAALQAMRKYDDARKLLEAAAAIREQLFGGQSVGYGLGLIKLAGLEDKRNQPNEAAAIYSKAAEVMGDRPEAVPALMYLGQNMLANKNYDQAIEHFQKAENLDSTQAGPAQMWMAIVSEREQLPDAAEAFYRSALSVEAENSIQAATTLDLFTQFLKDQGRSDESKFMSDRVSAARRALTKSRQTSPNVYRIGNGVTAPKVLYKVEPAYPEEARLAKYQGTVALSLEIGADGIPRNFQVLRGLGLGLDENAISAVQQWHFQPGMRDGAPVTVAATVEINFRLE